MANENGRQGQYIQSLDRGLTILDAVANSRHPVSLGELTVILGIDRSSVFRLATTLRRRGFLACPAGRKDYVLGPSLWRLAQRYDWSNMLIKVSHQQLKHLAAITNETAHLAVREGKQALFINHADADTVIVVSGQTGELVPLYCTAHGKALLADSNERDLKALFGAGPLQAYTKHTITTLKELAKACNAVGRSGYAVDDEEYQEQLRCVAAPIRAEDGAIVGSIGISAPLSRMSKEQCRNYGQQVVKIAERIRALLSNVEELSEEEAQTTQA
jgi:IclR family acetate operon transcriptional repressor